MNYIKLFCCIFILFLYTAILHAQDSHWNVNIHNYQYDMTVYAQVIDDKTLVTDYSSLEVAAFVGDECRGVATVQSAEKDGVNYQWLSIRVRSNVASGEVVSFKMYDKTQDNVLNFSETVTFSSQGNVGMPSSPFGLNIVKFTPGDVNDDGNILLNDATMIINYVLGKSQSNFNQSAADLNGDGMILLNDATMIINKIIGK